jgi:quercetin dioxygenase-like cupin family protein
MTLTAGQYHKQGDWPAIEAVPGVVRQVLACSEQLMIVRFVIQAGAEVPMHTHPHEQTGHVVSGQVRMRIGDQERELSPGDGYSIPGGIPHGAIGVTETVVVDSFHPVRDDYR